MGLDRQIVTFFLDGAAMMQTKHNNAKAFFLGAVRMEAGGRVIPGFFALAVGFVG